MPRVKHRVTSLSPDDDTTTFVRLQAVLLFIILQSGDYDLGSALDVDVVGVDAEIVVAHIAPFAAGVVLVVLAPLLFDGLDVLFHLGVGVVGLFGGDGVLSRNLVLHAGADEDGEDIAVTQDVVRAASDDDAGAFGGDLLDHLGLLEEDGVREGRLIIGVDQAALKGRAEQLGSLFLVGLQKALVEPAHVRDLFAENRLIFAELY